ncbi:MAG: ATPase, T2SS/T4P/T4SS family [Candidatus Micrarchaeota archaeon]
MKTLESYTVVNESVPAEIAIIEEDKDYINHYELRHTKIKDATSVALNYLKEKIIESIQIKISEILDPREAENIKQRLITRAHALVQQELSGLSKEEENVIVGRLVQDMVGLGEIEFLLSDENLEEIVVNCSREPVWVYHKKYGWLKTNIVIPTEEQIHNYASIIGRRIGKQVTNLNPLMDAHLLSGHRVNSTLFPISTKGNSITIRKFAKDPWTIIRLMENNTINSEVAALVWLGVQYEMNVLVAGGTASGKTSFLNSILAFTPPNQRLISIEDTRELQLPEFLHWTPMVTRQPNPEGKGEVTMLDLIVNSLRMRPDRIVMGEVRRQNEAEVLFEAMHTGHAVYATLHADTSNQVRQRLISPPIELPESMLGALHMIVVQYRQRRTGMRRTYEVAEVVPKEDSVSMNVIYKWDPRSDKILPVEKAHRLLEDLSLHTGMTSKEINDDLKDKRAVLEYVRSKGINNVDEVGKIVGWYYRDPERVLSSVEKKKSLDEMLE